MDNPTSVKKVSIEEALYRLRFMFIMIMSIPLFGMVSAIVLLYRLKVNNLSILVGAITLMIVFYATTSYLVIRQILNIGKSNKLKRN
jgi:hypothetical protein